MTVVFCALPTIAVLGFIAVSGASVPTQQQMDAVLAGAPSGTIVVSEDAGCASAECWREARLAPPDGGTISDVLEVIDLPIGTRNCGVTSWWDWRETCVASQTSSDPRSAAVSVVITQRAADD